MFHFDKGHENAGAPSVPSPKDRVTNRRAWLRRLIPGVLYRRAMTKRLVVKSTELKNISICLADTLEEREKAFQLAHAAYVDRGIAIATRSGLKFSPFHLLPGTTTFVAKRGTHVLGTVSLIEDSPIGIPMESVHPEEVGRLRHAGRRFAEVSTLCVAPDVRGRGISLALYQAMVCWARRHRLIEDLVIAVHPKMRDFFCHGLLFERMGPTREYGSLNSALSAPLCIDLTSAPSRYRAAYDRSGMQIMIADCRTNLYRFFTEDALACVKLPEIASHPFALSRPPLWTEDDVSAYLHGCGVNVASQSRQVRRLIETLYPGMTETHREKVDAFRFAAVN